MTQYTIRERFLWVLKNTLNRVTTAMARSGHGPFSLIRHVGRKSGRIYETPVILGKVPEGPRRLWHAISAAVESCRPRPIPLALHRQHPDRRRMTKVALPERRVTSGPK
jgi:hypothetical protein